MTRAQPPRRPPLALVVTSAEAPADVAGFSRALVACILRQDGALLPLPDDRTKEVA